MSDRAGDNETFGESMAIPESKNLKCCAHITLGVDNACDKVFWEAEQRIGVHNLISVKVEENAFTSSGSSIKGFTANRFSRIAHLANRFLKVKDQVLKFFDSVVDINSNKLVLVVSVYIQSDWFSLCRELYRKIADLVIFPLMDLLGIAERGKSLKNVRDWYGVGDFFKLKLPEIDDLCEQLKSGNGKDRLYSATLKETSKTLWRQLSAMPFFFDILEHDEAQNDKLPDPNKLTYAPLTNLGCESEFASFDNRVKISGGTESIQSISRKRVICTNALLVDSSFDNLSDKESLDSWKWARTSKEGSEVRKLERDFLATVKMSKKLVLAKKEELKRKKNLRLLQTIDICKERGGPLTDNNLELVESLSEKQLISEVVFLRLNVAPNIRQQRRAKNSNTGKFRVETFTAEELCSSIGNAIKGQKFQPIRTQHPKWP